jgi:AraC-like DNA-binding protein
MISKSEFDRKGYMNKPTDDLGGSYTMETVPNIFVDPENPTVNEMIDAAEHCIFKSPYSDVTIIDDFIDEAFANSGDESDELIDLQKGDPEFARCVAEEKSELICTLLFNKINDSHMKAIYRALTEFINNGVDSISGLDRYAKDLKAAYTEDFFGHNRTVYYAPIPLCEFGYVDNSNPYNVNLLKRYMIYKCEMKTAETFSSVVKIIAKDLSKVVLSSGEVTSDEIIDYLGYSLVEILSAKFREVVELDKNNVEMYIKNIKFFDAASYAKSLAPREYDYDLPVDDDVPTEETKEDESFDSLAESE